MRSTDRVTLARWVRDDAARRFHSFRLRDSSTEEGMVRLRDLLHARVDLARVELDERFKSEWRELHRRAAWAAGLAVGRGLEQRAYRERVRKAFARDGRLDVDYVTVTVPCRTVEELT